MRKNRTFIIAEAGVNHNGSILLGKKLIDAAKRAGADAIKFQSFKTEKLVNRTADKADYQKKTTSANESQYQMLKRVELSRKDHIKLIDYCRKRKITFLSSPFDEESADLLEEMGVEMFKIPSGEVTNTSLLHHIAQKKKPIILSTGMSTLGEVEEALETIFAAGNRKVSLLHCVTEYPAPFDAINLQAMLTMKRAFCLPVGYSDHTEGIEICIAAVALGAEIIEKHFTLDRNMEGPDHKASIEPGEMEKMVNAIRNVEASMGDGIKRPMPCELKNINIARKSVVAARFIKRGEKITEENILLKRPGYGIQPKDFKKIIGLRAKIDIKEDDVITWENME